MFCPQCKLEYRPGFTRCSDCDVDLVETLDAATSCDSGSEDHDNVNLHTPELFWSGVDTGTFSRLRAALDQANISYDDQPLDARWLYASMRNPLEIWIQKSDRDAARQATSGISAEIGSHETDELPEDEAAGNDNQQASTQPEVTGPFADRSEDDERSDGEETFDNLEFFDPEEATLEIWNGSDADLAQNLKMCLRENGIGSQIDASSGSSKLMIYPAHERRAKQIIQEVVEGVPPE